MHLTKTKSRTEFRSDTFDSSIVNAPDGQYLHEMDFAAFVEPWAKEGHQGATQSLRGGAPHKESQPASEIAPTH